MAELLITWWLITRKQLQEQMHPWPVISNAPTRKQADCQSVEKQKSSGLSNLNNNICYRGITQNLINSISLPVNTITRYFTGVGALSCSQYKTENEKYRGQSLQQVIELLDIEANSKDYDGQQKFFSSYCYLHFSRYSGP